MFSCHELENFRIFINEATNYYFFNSIIRDKRETMFSYQEFENYRILFYEATNN